VPLGPGARRTGYAIDVCYFTSSRPERQIRGLAVGDVDEIPQGQVAVGKDEEGIGVELVYGLLDDRPLDGAGQVVGGEVGVDDAKVALLGQVDRGLSVAAHKPSDASGPVADREGEFVGVLVAQGVEEFQGGVEGAMVGEVG